MARHRKRRRNPTGTLLVNSGKRGSKRSAKRSSKRAVQLASLFSRVANPRRRGRKRRNPLLVNRGRGRRRARRNPLLVNRGRGHRRSAKRRNPSRRASSRRASSRRSSRRRRNPLLVNRGRGRRRSSRRRNPLLVNRRRSSRRRNPLLVNRGRSSKRRRNPGMLGGFVSKGQGYARKVPLVGGLLSAMLGGAGAALAGAVGVLPTDYAMEYIGPRVPSMLRPVAYSIGGLALSAIVEWLPNFPYKDKIQVGMMFAGGAVDSYRARRGTSMSLGDMDGDDYAEDDMGDAWGEDGGQFADEYADADLSDAEYCGDDLSAEEMETAELGRKVWRKRYKAKKKKDSKDGESESSKRGAGQPGKRWKWMIYWIGFDNFQALSQMEEGQRKEVIRKLKLQAAHSARALLNSGADSSVEEAETAGLLALG